MSCTMFSRACLTRQSLQGLQRPPVFAESTLALRQCLVLSAYRMMCVMLPPSLPSSADVNAREGRAVVQAARWKDTYSLAYLESLGADMSVLQANPAWAALWPPKERVSSS